MNLREWEFHQQNLVFGLLLLELDIFREILLMANMLQKLVFQECVFAGVWDHHLHLY